MTHRDVVAAGGLVWRDAGDRREVLLVHRPRYDDWSLPKGKLRPSEHVLAAAAREITEETGLTVTLGPPLGVQRYDVRMDGGAAVKLVHYWAARPLGTASAFEPNDEVDQIGWHPVAQARDTLSYPRDVALVDDLDAVVSVTATLVLLRHTAALRRGDWHATDAGRPLSADGAVSADRLVDVLAALGVDRILSSDAERCRATVAPYAAKAGLTIAEHPETSERGYQAAPDRVRGLSATAWAAGHVTVVCSHRPVLPALASELGLKVGPFAPGAFVVAHRLASGRLITQRFGSP